MNSKHKNTFIFLKKHKNKKITLRKKISIKFRSLTLFKIFKKSVHVIFLKYLYKYFYKSIVYFFTILYLKYLLKYKNFTYYKIFTKSKNKDFHGNASFAYCSAKTPSNKKVFIKIGNNLTDGLHEAKIAKKFYSVAHEHLKCLHVIKNIETPIISFIACEYIDGITLKKFVNQILQHKKKMTKQNKEGFLKQLEITLKKLLEAKIYGSKTCATHSNNMLISFNKKSELFITIIDFGKYKPYKKNIKECDYKNIYNILKIVNDNKKIFGIANKEIDKHFRKYINIKTKK